MGKYLEARRAARSQRQRRGYVWPRVERTRLAERGTARGDFDRRDLRLRRLNPQPTANTEAQRINRSASDGFVEVGGHKFF